MQRLARVMGINVWPNEQVPLLTTTDESLSISLVQFHQCRVNFGQDIRYLAHDQCV
jgi:hypothetical protein